MNTARRRDDSGAYTRFRSNRFCQQGGKWFFFTRERTMEGPFDYRAAAEIRLADYIKVMTSGLMPTDCDLAILPLDPSKPN
ncbi:MAG: hypothetical protein KDI10_04200 [Halioglobus sp.]|nr:hypothetical protein [Halioglobus sp.]